MKFKGISFNIINESNAINILENSNYYFKLSNYKNNFMIRNIKHQNEMVSRYTDLEFKHLVDLSSLDMQLRYVLIKLCLDIEHSIKLMIMRTFTDNNQYNGNDIINDYFDFIKNNTSIKNPYLKFLRHVKDDNYLNSEFLKYETEKPLWFVIEHIQFGGLCWFVEFLYNEKSIKEFKELSKTIKIVKNIRNKAAHNSPILDDIVILNQLEGSDKNKLLVEYAKRTVINKKTINKRMTNYKTHDLISIFFVYDLVVRSEAMKSHRKSELLEFMKRAKRNKEIYDERFKSVYHFFDKVLAIF